LGDDLADFTGLVDVVDRLGSSTSLSTSLFWSEIAIQISNPNLILRFPNHDPEVYLN